MTEKKMVSEESLASVSGGADLFTDGSSEHNNGKYVVTAGELNFRAGPETNSMVLGTLYRGEIVNHVFGNGDFWCVYSERLQAQGYVASAYLQPLG